MIHRLSTRQREIFLAYGAGSKQVEIADFYGVSPKTVREHLRRAMEKLRMTRTSEIIEYFVVNKL